LSAEFRARIAGWRPGCDSWGLALQDEISQLVAEKIVARQALGGSPVGASMLRFRGSFGETFCTA